MTDQEILEKLLEIAWANGFTCDDSYQGLSNWGEVPSHGRTVLIESLFDENLIEHILFSNPKEGIGFIEALCISKGADLTWHRNLRQLSVVSDEHRLAYLAREFL